MIQGAARAAPLLLLTYSALISLNVPLLGCLLHFGGTGIIQHSAIQAMTAITFW